MDFIHIINLALQITLVITKHRHKKKHDLSSSDETIENLLYFKDCQKKPFKEPLTTTTTTRSQAVLKTDHVPIPQALPQQPTCLYPKMCCSLSCNNDCKDGATDHSFVSRQMEPVQNMNMQRLGIEPIQPMMYPIQPIQQQPVRKRKKMKFPVNQMQFPVTARRDAGFTKAKIKSLISQDDDIRKILQDLVRVTMQKVDLLELMKRSDGRDDEVKTPPDSEPANEDYIE